MKITWYENTERNKILHNNLKELSKEEIKMAIIKAIGDSFYAKYGRVLEPQELKNAEENIKMTQGATCIECAKVNSCNTIKGVYDVDRALAIIFIFFQNVCQEFVRKK